MTSAQKIPWKRLATESFVIVASILLAFAIDAWWNDRQELRLQNDRLARVAAEVELNRGIVAEKIDILERAIAGTSEYLAWMGPEPRDVAFEQYARQWDRMLDIGMYALVHRATDEYLGAGSASTDERSGIRALLLAWYAEGDRIEQQYDLLRGRHEALVRYTTSTGEPVLASMGHLAIMQAHPKSRFPTDAAGTLADPVIESLLALYLVRMEFVSRRMIQYRDYQDDLLMAIREVVGSPEQGGEHGESAATTR